MPPTAQTAKIFVDLRVSAVELGCKDTQMISYIHPCKSAWGFLTYHSDPWTAGPLYFNRTCALKCVLGRELTKASYQKDTFSEGNPNKIRVVCVLSLPSTRARRMRSDMLGITGVMGSIAGEDRLTMKNVGNLLSGRCRTWRGLSLGGA